MYLKGEDCQINLVEKNNTLVDHVEPLNGLVQSYDFKDLKGTEVSKYFTQWKCKETIEFGHRREKVSISKRNR